MCIHFLALKPHKAGDQQVPEGPLACHCHRTGDSDIPARLFDGATDLVPAFDTLSTNFCSKFNPVVVQPVDRKCPFCQRRLKRAQPRRSILGQLPGTTTATRPLETIRPRAPQEVDQGSFPIFEILTHSPFLAPQTAGSSALSSNHGRPSCLSRVQPAGRCRRSADAPG